MACYNIMAVVVNYRSKNSSEVQKVLSKFACNIKVRLGLHEAGDVCSDEGLIILQLAGTKTEIQEFEGELNIIEGVNAKVLEVCS